MPADLPPVYLLIVYTIATASVVRLITIDTLFDRPRDAFVGRMFSGDKALRGFVVWVDERLDDKRWSAGWWTTRAAQAVAATGRFALWSASKMVTCPWCVGFWASLITLWARPHWDHPTVLFLALGLAMRQVIGLIADR